MSRKKMAIIASYFSGESYGLLGPQMAATIIQKNTAYDCMVLAVDRQDDKAILKKALADYFGSNRPVIGFSTLSGREDLFELARELKEQGAFTILAGPQANVDYMGEKEWQNHPERFNGLSRHFTCALWGPAEQAIHLLNHLNNEEWLNTPGLLYINQTGHVIQNPKKTWDEDFLKEVDWRNIYRLNNQSLEPLPVYTGQVLQQIGCPHANRMEAIELDYPDFLTDRPNSKVQMQVKGCNFCDVAVDKGFHGMLDLKSVLAQIQCLPELPDGRKIPFELINENPLPGLPHLLETLKENGPRISQINLTLRADGLVIAKEQLEQSLRLARQMDVRTLASSIGFESFSDHVLKQLHKGSDLKTNLEAIRLMRWFKKMFPLQWFYSRQDGSQHGLIHPTPWDTQEVLHGIQTVVRKYGLEEDILPFQSIPLIIHHASCLGDWIREIEHREQISFKRYVSAIGWWPEAMIVK
jgi:hypothetical protein